MDGAVLVSVAYVTRISAFALTLPREAGGSLRRSRESGHFVNLSPTKKTRPPPPLASLVLQRERLVEYAEIGGAVYRRVWRCEESGFLAIYYYLNRQWRRRNPARQRYCYSRRSRRRRSRRHRRRRRRRRASTV